DLTADNRRRRMHPKWRNQLRKAESHRLRLRELVWDGTPHWLTTQASAVARKRGFRTLPTALLACFAQINKGDALIFEAYAKGHPIAAILALRHGATATYQTGWTSAEGRALHAHNQLLDHAASRLAQLGHTTFDLGLVETDTAPALTHFKCGTGAAVRRLGGTWIRLGKTGGTKRRP
ncbi:MAG: GNAT family N-acetyltransferase, partial [Octadecabacter sp.]|nr:GNAT family N-acetyltransferase [Octadecabacter sp.]